jgi:hypothetical protein
VHEAQGLVAAVALLRPEGAGLHERVRDAVEDLGLLASPVPPDACTYIHVIIE